MAGITSVSGTFGGATINSSSICIYYLSTPTVQGTFWGATTDASSLELGKTTDKLYVKVTDQLGNPLPFTLVIVKWTRSDGSTYETQHYTDAEGWLSVSVPSDVVGAKIVVGDVSYDVPEPQAGGYIELTPTIQLILRVVDSATKKPLGGLAVDLGELGTYVTGANGEIKVPVPQYGVYTARIRGGYRYYSKTEEISITKDTETIEIEVSRRFVPIVR